MSNAGKLIIQTSHTMTVDELQNRKKILESSILDLLKEFQKDTGIPVRSIYQQTASVHSENDTILSVDVELSL